MQNTQNGIRYHATSIPKGRAFSGRTLRVCARVYGRDLYQFGLRSNSELEESAVAFALTISAPPGQGTASIYNSLATSLGNYVESAVNDIDVNVT